MKKWKKVLIISLSVVVLLAAGGICTYEFYIAPKVVEPALEKVQKLLNDENVKQSVDELVNEMIESGYLKEEDLKEYYKYQEYMKEDAGSNDADVTENGEENAVSSGSKSDKTGNKDVAGSTDSPDETGKSPDSKKTSASNKTGKSPDSKKTSASNKTGKNSKTPAKSNALAKNSYSSESSGKVGKSGNNVNGKVNGDAVPGTSGGGGNIQSVYKGDEAYGPPAPEGYEPGQYHDEATDSSQNAAPKKPMTLIEKAQAEMSADEFAFAMSVYSRIDVGYVTANMYTNRAAVKEYVYSRMSRAEVSRALSLYSKYSYILSN